MNTNQQTEHPTFTRLIGKAKFALRIDLRDNDANSTKLMTILDTLEIVGNNDDFNVTNTTISSHATATAKLNKSKSGLNDTNGVWGNAGIAGKKGDLSAPGNNNTNSGMTLGRGMSIPNMNGLQQSDTFIRDAEEGMRIEDAVLGSPTGQNDGQGSFMPIGSYIDEKIRQMQQTNSSKHTGTNNGKDKDMNTSFTGGKSVNERINVQTRAIYSNKIIDLDGGNDIRGLAASDGYNNYNTNSPKKKQITKPKPDPILQNILNDSNSNNRNSNSNTIRKSNSGTIPTNQTPNSAKKTRPRSANAATRKSKPKVDNLNKFNPALLF